MRTRTESTRDRPASASAAAVAARGRRTASAAVLLGVLLAGGAGRAQAAPEELERRLAQQGRAYVVVMLEAGEWPASVQEQVRLAGRLQSEALAGELRQGFEVVRRFHSVPALAGWMRPQALDAVRQARTRGRSVVRSVDLDQGGGARMPAAGASSGGGGLAQSVALIRANELHAAGVNGAGIEVAVLDSGLDASHPDLERDLVAEQCFCFNPAAGCCPNGQASQSGRGSAQDDHGHGTHVSGILGGDGRVASVGVAPAARITMIKMLDRSNSFFSSSDIVASLDWLNTQRPSVRVVSMSLFTGVKFSGVCDASFSWTQALHAAAQNLVRKGVVLVAIAGNDGLSGQIVAPGCLSNVFSAGASTKADTVAGFSNSGAEVDVFAPGVDIVSSRLGGGTVSFSGTSMACPHVSGLAALLLQAVPGLTADALLSAIRETGVPLSDASGLTRRRIDAVAAAQRAGLVPGAPTATPTPRQQEEEDDEGGCGGVAAPRPPAGLAVLALLVTLACAQMQRRLRPRPGRATRSGFPVFQVSGAALSITPEMVREAMDGETS